MNGMDATHNIQLIHPARHKTWDSIRIALLNNQDYLRFIWESFYRNTVVYWQILYDLVQIDQIRDLIQDFSTKGIGMLSKIRSLNRMIMAFSFLLTILSRESTCNQMEWYP